VAPAADVLLWGLAGFVFLLVCLQFTPVAAPRWALTPILFGLAYVAHFIPMPWLAYVAASGLIPVVFKLSGGHGEEETYGEQLRSKWFAVKFDRQRKARVRPPSQPGSRIPPLP
jgi:hypothetical protein